MEHSIDQVHNNKVSNVSNIVDIDDVSTSQRSTQHPSNRQFLKLPPSLSDIRGSLNLNNNHTGHRRLSQNLQSSFENFSFHKLENSDSDSEVIEVLEDYEINERLAQGQKKSVVIKQREIIDVELLRYHKPVTTDTLKINRPKDQPEDEEHSTHEILSHFKFWKKPIIESQAQISDFNVNEAEKESEAHSNNEKKLIILPKPTEASIVKRTRFHVFSRKPREGIILAVSIGCLMVMTLIVMIYHESQFLPPNLIYAIL